jgi:hypothetical protein
VAVGAVLTFLRCWTVLYGAVAMEVFGHMSFALTDPAPMFEITLGDLAAWSGCATRCPADRRPRTFTEHAGALAGVQDTPRHAKSFQMLSYSQH